MKILAKSIILSVCMVLAGNHLMAMEIPTAVVTETEENKTSADDTQIPSPNQKKNSKSKSKKKKKTKQQPQVSIEDLKKAIDGLLLKQKGSEERDLKKLQWVANLLLFQMRLIEGMRNISAFIPHLVETEQYRYIDHKFYDGFSWIGEEQRSNCKDDPGLHNLLHIQSPEAISLALRLVDLSRHRYVYSKQEANWLEFWYQKVSDDTEKTKVCGLAKHRMYAGNLHSELFFSLRSMIYVIASKTKPESLQEMLTKITRNDLTACDADIVKFLSLLPSFDESFTCAHVLTKVIWDAMEENECSKILITPEILEQKKKVDQLITHIDAVAELYRDLYAYTYQIMKQLYTNAAPKNKKQLLNCLNRNERLFWISDKILESASEKAIIDFYGLWPIRLPETLDCLTKSEHERLVQSAAKESKKKKEPKQQQKKSPKGKKSKGATKSDKEEIVEEMKSLALEKSASEVPAESKEHVQQSQACILPDATYDKRLHQWFDSEYIKDKEYKDVLYHCFSRLVDFYLFDIGIKQKRMNKTTGKETDISYQLGGQITYPHSASKNNTQLVVFHATKDKNGICYHRGVELKENNALFDEYFANSYWQVFHREEFPVLSTAIKPDVKTSEAEEVIAEDDLCVKINDPRLGIEITLFKPIKE